MRVSLLAAALERLTRDRSLDLGDYRADVLTRRLEARMSATGAAAAEYLALLDRDGEERQRLADALLVHVTAPFRDAEVFAALPASVLPGLAPGRVLRAWAIGVATGEEAWSLAALLAAVRGEAWELLATDRDAACVRAAEEGALDAAALRAAIERLPWPGAGGLLQAFDVTGERARPARALRARARFAVHDFMGPQAAPREAIVASFSLVLCRNVLVYFDARFRDAAGGRLAGVVEPGGALVLGATESLTGAAAARFEPFPALARRLRVLRRLEAPC